MDRDYLEFFRPVFETRAFVWFGGLLWLSLAVDWKRFWSLRTVDVLAILLAGILFEFRQENREATVLGHRATWSFIAWTGIYSVCGYLFLRTLGQVLRRAARETASPGIGAAAWLLLAFTVSTNFCSLTETPVGDEGRTAVRGGAYLRTTGKLPYGQIADAGSCGPLMYALHAVFADQAAASDGSTQAGTTAVPLPAAPSFSERDAATARWVAGVAHGLLLLGMVVLGWQLHSASIGAMLAGLYGLLVPVISQHATATVTLPAALLLWSLVAMAPRAGGWGAALGGLLLAAAAWASFSAALLFPAWLAYCLRRTSALRTATARAAEESAPVLAPQAGIGRLGDRPPRDFGATTFVAACLIAAGVGAWYVSGRTPLLPPRTDFTGVAGPESAGPAYVLTVDRGRFVLQPDTASTRSSIAIRDYLGAQCLRWLAADGNRGDEPAFSAERLQEVPNDAWREVGVTPPETVLFNTAEPVQFRRVRPANAEAARALAVLYRRQVKEYSRWRSCAATVRTLVEAAWYDGPRPAGAWEQWKLQCAREAEGGGTNGRVDGADAARHVRRIDELHGSVLTGHVGVALLLFVVLVSVGSRCTHWHLCAITAALMAGGQLWKVHDGGAYFAWYLPVAMLALFAGRPPAGRPASRS